MAKKPKVKSQQLVGALSGAKPGDEDKKKFPFPFKKKSGKKGAEKSDENPFAKMKKSKKKAKPKKKG